MSEQKKQQVIALGRLGWSLRRIQRATGVRRETAAAYLRADGIVVAKPATPVFTDSTEPKPAISDEVFTDSTLPEPTSEDAEKPATPKPATPVFTDPTEPKPAISNEVFTDPALAEPTSEVAENPAISKPATPVITDFGAEFADAGTAPRPQPSQSPAASACTLYQELIERGFALGRNAMAIWQELVDTCGFTGSYQSVRRFLRKLHPSSSPEARAVIETEPGEECQVDYGTGPMVRDAHTGKYRRTRLFVLTLGYSRKAVRLLTFRSSTRIWAELHERAFQRLGGCTRVVVLDNLREGVLTPDIYDPTLNPLYRDVLQHYGVVALPCRIADPDRKGKVESGVAHAQKTPLKGQRFETLEEAQTYLDHWETRWADTRIHGTTKRQVAAMFAEERPALQPLPLEPFRYYQYGERTVHLDGCVEVEAAYYSAPPGWIGRKVQVQWDAHQVRLLDPKTGQLLREHHRQMRGRHRIKDEDLPKHTPLGTQQLLFRADHAGPRIGALCRGIHAQHGQTGVRRIQGVLSLAKKYGIAHVEEACAVALEFGVYDYHFVRRYLERNTPPPLTLRQVDPLIRQLTLYRDFIESKTKENEL